MSEEEDEDEEESDDDTRDLVLQSSSLSSVDEQKDLLGPPAKQPRMSLNLQWEPPPSASATRLYSRHFIQARSL